MTVNPFETSRLRAYATELEVQLGLPFPEQALLGLNEEQLQRHICDQFRSFVYEKLGDAILPGVQGQENLRLTHDSRRHLDYAVGQFWVKRDQAEQALRSLHFLVPGLLAHPHTIQGNNPEAVLIDVHYYFPSY